MVLPTKRLGDCCDGARYGKTESVLLTQGVGNSREGFLEEVTSEWSL